MLYHLTAAVGALWGGQRDPAALTAGLDAPAAVLLRRMLVLLQGSTSERKAAKGTSERKAARKQRRKDS
ncbi:MAG: hypothetical protein OHK0022_48400 [Roseiflexaceae bacterium]